MHEDEFVIHKILWECDKIAVVDEALYFYTIRDNSIIAKYTSQRIEDTLAALESRVNFANAHKIYDVFIVAVKGYCDYAIDRYYDIKTRKEKLDAEWLKRLWIAERYMLERYDNIEIPKQYRLFAKNPRCYERWYRNMKRKERYVGLMNRMKGACSYISSLYKR